MGVFMNKWLKVGLTGMALTTALTATASEVVKREAQSELSQKPAFTIEASELVAKKMRDYKSGTETIELPSFSIEASDLVAKKARDYKSGKKPTNLA